MTRILDPIHIIPRRISLAEAPGMYSVWRDKQAQATKIVIDP